MTKFQELQQKYLAKIEETETKLQSLEDTPEIRDFDRLRNAEERYRLRMSMMAYYDFIYDIVELEKMK